MTFQPRDLEGVPAGTKVHHMRLIHSLGDDLLEDYETTLCRSEYYKRREAKQVKAKP